jgi:hypothetical protein
MNVWISCVHGDPSGLDYEFRRQSVRMFPFYACRLDRLAMISLN